MTSSFFPPGSPPKSATLLGQIGVPAAAWHGGTLVVRSPINGEAIGPGARDLAGRRGAGRGRRAPGLPGLAQRAGAAPRRAGAPARRGAAHAQGRARPAGDARGRQDHQRRPGRSAGDDRHLRLRGRPVAPALRPDHRHRAARPPHDGDLASARRGRRHLGLQLPGRGVVVERGAGAGVRRHRASGSRRRRRRSPRWRCRRCSNARAARFGAEAPAGLSAGGASAGARSARRWSTIPAWRWSRPPARPRMGRAVGPRLAARFAPRDPGARRQQRRHRRARRPISTWRCAASRSPPWARPASAARRCAG